MAARPAKRGGAKGGGAPTTPMDMWVARARGVGALIGFAIAFWICHRQGFTTTDAVLRGLIGAVALSLVSWWSALLVIQALMRAAAVETSRGGDDAAQAQGAAARAAAGEGS